jgi:hypothetical protein
MKGMHCNIQVAGQYSLQVPIATAYIQGRFCNGTETQPHSLLSTVYQVLFCVSSYNDLNVFHKDV